MLRVLVMFLAALFMTSCASVQIETTGWKAIDGTGITKEALETLKGEQAPKKVFRMSGLVLLETSCKASYSTWFKTIQRPEGQICGATAQADVSSGEVDLNRVIADILMRRSEEPK